MCGIAGFSLSRDSRVNVRRLSRALLCEIEARGSHASGFAWTDSKAFGVFKRDVPGSKLSLSALPRSASNVILHTRYATHGSQTVMANNHPVLSPDSSIALVHNGVIYNHNRVRSELPFTLPEVDTSVIPAILQNFGGDTDKFSMLDGDAAVAWLDFNDLGVMRVARVSHSPLCVAQLVDGSFVFASTESLLVEALRSAGLKAVSFRIVGNSTLLQVYAGRIIEESVLPLTDPAFEEVRSYGSTSKYRGMTAGGVSTPAMDDSLDLTDPGFEWWLSQFYEVDGSYFTYDGVFVGRIDYMREEYEEYRYDQYWTGANDSQFSPFASSKWYEV